MMLSICLTGNIFALGPVTNVGTIGLVPGLLSSGLQHVLSMFSDDNCPWRICQNCRPNNGEDDDGNGNCRPKGN